MRKMKKILIVFLVLLGVMAGFALSNVQASNPNSLFTGGILSRNNLQAYTLSGDGLDLRIEEKRQSGNIYSWNISTDDEGLIVWKFLDSESFENLYYCLNHEIGFASSDGDIGDTHTDRYTVSYDMKNNENKAEIIAKAGWTENAIENDILYNNLLWILEHMYIPEYKNNYWNSISYQMLMKYAGIEIDSNPAFNLTEDDIDSVQQMVIWHFVNNQPENTTLPPLYINGTELRSLSNGRVRQTKAEKLYQYFINNVPNTTGNYEASAPTLTLSNANVKVEELADSFLVGPFQLTGSTTEEIISITDNVNLEYTLLNASKREVENNDFTKVIGGDFYLKIRKSNVTENTTPISIALTYYYNRKTLTALTDDSPEDTQLVVNIEEETQHETIQTDATISLLEIEVEKNWDDHDNQDGLRPESIRVALYEGDTQRDSQTLSDENNWKYTWKRLAGDKTYTVKEIDEEGMPILNNGQYDEAYTKVTYVVSGDKTTITNQHIPEVVTKKVVKRWEDNKNEANLRPTSIKVQLYKIVNDTKIAVENQEILNSENNWTKTWDNLPKYDQGKKIIYTVEEEEIEPYTASYSAQDYEGVQTIIITNTYIPSNPDLALRKYITAINGETIETTNENYRVPQITTNGLDDDSSSTAIYKHKKDPIAVKTGDIVTYTITVYNEGESIARASQIIDQLPTGLRLTSTENITSTKGNIYTIDYDTTTNRVTLTTEGTNNLNAYQKNGELDSDTIQLQCEVTAEENRNNTILTNVAWISEMKDDQNQTFEVDRDSQTTSSPEVNKDHMADYSRPNENGYYPGQQDDDDFDRVVIPGKVIENELKVQLQKVGEDGTTPLSGAQFKVNDGEPIVVSIEGNEIDSIVVTKEGKLELTYRLEETIAPSGYEKAETKTVTITADVVLDEESEQYVLENVQLKEPVEGVQLRLENNTITIMAENEPIQQVFDLALRKWITAVNQETMNREPVVDTSTIASTGTATYRHTKKPVAVQKGDVVTYTIRVYNEGQLDGYVNKITDHLPENLLPIIKGVEGIDEERYQKEIEFNNTWLWTVLDNYTVVTSITSKENTETYAILTGFEDVTDTLLKAYTEGATTLDYIDVKIKCLVTENAVTGEYLTNIAEITDAEDINLEHWDGLDSELADAQYTNLADYKNAEAISSTAQSYIPGQQDDDDFEKLIVKEFDLALKKFITKVDHEGTQTTYHREPKVDASKLGTVGEDGKVITDATYVLDKTPVLVETNDLITYTIRVYNEGTLDGYANEIVDNIPEGLEFLPNSSVNIANGWEMLDKDGNVTTDVTKAVMIRTTYLSDTNHLIEAVKEIDGVKVLSYQDVEVQFKVIATAQKLQENIIKNVAQISADSDRDIDSEPNRDEDYDYTNPENNEDDIDYEPIYLQYFDLALRKFITKVNTTDYNNRYPEVVYAADGSISYRHSKEPVLVTTNDIIVYTIRVYNEGEKDGYATEITDNLPDGLEFLVDNEVNQQYRWKLIDSEGNVTTDVSKAVKVTTDYLKDQLIKGFKTENGQRVLSYRDVQIAFKVIESNTSNRILINVAEISKDSGNDVDSTPGNDDPNEDDLDKEYVKVKFFDLSLLKWVTETRVTYNGKTTVTKTGYTPGNEGIAKVDLVASKMKKTTVKFAYTIRVTNEGEIPGYAYEVKDYIPKGLQFVAADNPKWKEVKEGIVVTDQLKDTLLQPGESAEVEIVLTWKNSTTNTGLKTNYAEISDDSGNDIDSTPDNYNFDEDDIDDAQVILSIKTAGPTTYIALIFFSVVILASGIILIKKYVIR